MLTVPTLCKRYQSHNLAFWRPFSSSNGDKKDGEGQETPAKPPKEGEGAGGKTKEFPEEPTTCCMSGCANCVWLDYAEKLRVYFEDGGERAMKEIEERVADPNIKAFLLQELRMRYKKKP